MNVLSAASRLRLSSAKRRIASFLEQIDVLAESSFPHGDGEKVLSTIRDEFTRLTAMLEMPPSAKDAMAEQVCLNVADRVSDFTEILGFVLRSTNVRNAFELHYLLKKMVRQLLGECTNLLISSEWDYVPFTYPVGIELLPDVVLIGSPAPESSNPLIVPLAGHEIGHSAWRAHGLADMFSGPVDVAVDEAIAARRRAADANEDEPGDLVSRSSAAVIRDRSADHALHQIEEVYCDLLALFVFGPSYLYAYDYLLGPGGPDRTLNYPSDGQRIEFLLKAAADMGVAVDGDLSARWVRASCPPEQKAMEMVVDAAVATIIPSLTEHVIQFMKETGFTSPDPAVVAAIVDTFDRGEPYSERALLGEIITAGWTYLRSNQDLAEPDQRERYNVLTDLMWKTVEVTEYLERLAVDA